VDRETIDNSGPEQEIESLKVGDRQTSADGESDAPAALDPAVAPVCEAAAEPVPSACDTEAEAIVSSAKVEQQDETPEKKSPQKAFDGLRDAIGSLRADVRELCESSKLVRNYVRDTQLEGKRVVFDSLFQVFDTLFKKVVAMEAGHDPPDAFTVGLMELLQGELLRHGIAVIWPQPGEALELNVMSTSNSVRCPFWRKSNTVARACQCGFLLDGTLVLRKARVDVYRRG